MKMFLILSLIVIANTAQAGLTLNTLWKYGVNGYEASGVNQSSSNSSSSNTGKGKKQVSVSNSTSNSINTLDIDNRYQIVPGIGFEVSPQYDGVCIGAGYYFDNTIQMSLGWKLF